MYDWPEVRAATDALWSGIAAHLRTAGIDAPSRLERALGLQELWRHPGLVLGQTCGLPYVLTLRGAVQLVATPCYTAEGCAGPDYSSAILVRADDAAADLEALDGRVAAINDPMSLSGSLALRTVQAECTTPPTFSGVRESGSHRASMRMVADGTADVCAIDAVCWALAQRHMPEVTRRLRVLTWSPPAPALPFICATGIDTAAVRGALQQAMADPDLVEARAALLLDDVAVLDDSAYDRVVAMAEAG